MLKFDFDGQKFLSYEQKAKGHFLSKIADIGNKILYFLAHKSPLIRYSSVVALMVSLFAAWTVFLMRPLHAQLGIHKAKLKQLHKLKKQYAQGATACGEIAQQIKELGIVIDTHLNQMGAKSAYKNLGKIVECIHRNGVTLVSYGPFKKERKVLANKNSLAAPSSKQSIRTTSFELVLEGSFVPILNLFDCLSLIKYGVQYNQWRLQALDNGSIVCRMIVDVIQCAR